MTPFFVLTLDYGKHGIELQAVEATRATLIQDLLDGQYNKPLRVLEVIPGEGSCRDVSEALARDIAARRELLSDGLIHFVWVHCGDALANELRAA